MRDGFLIRWRVGSLFTITLHLHLARQPAIPQRVGDFFHQPALAINLRLEPRHPNRCLGHQLWHADGQIQVKRRQPPVDALQLTLGSGQCIRLAAKGFLHGLEVAVLLACNHFLALAKLAVVSQRLHAT